MNIKTIKAIRNFPTTRKTGFTKKNLLILASNLDYLVLGTNTTNLADACVALENNAEYRDAAESDLGMSWDSMKSLMLAFDLNYSAQ
jgi:hypothetical protein